MEQGVTTLNIHIAEPVPLRVDEHGVIRIGDTRVLLDLVIAEYEAGASAEEIVEGYDALELADVHAVISYYLRHRDEVRRYMEERAAVGKELRAECERRLPMTEVRDRLEARRRAARVCDD
jgi:uncharacterized protein (DUF433 family)